ncbi:MAG: hypothetical protein ACKN9V_04280, partial [Pseudomonadota bacterium]
ILSTSESLLGSEILDNIFISTSEEIWTLRNAQGIPIRQFPALASQPVQLQGNRKSGFWSLQFQKENNFLEVIYFNSRGEVIWSKPVSKNTDLWSQPKLNYISKRDQLWISYTTASIHHAYSPLVELWNSKGEKIKIFPYSDRGVLLDTCKTVNDEFLVSRDIPSSPYTVPLFSFLELLTPDSKPKSIYQAGDNYLISSIQCRPDAIWALQKSVLGSQSTLLVELSPKMEEKNVIVLKEPAWKIHACSLQ